MNKIIQIFILFPIIILANTYNTREWESLREIPEGDGFIKDDDITSAEVIHSLKKIIYYYDFSIERNSLEKRTEEGCLEQIAWLIIYIGNHLDGSDEIDEMFQKLREKVGDKKVHYTINGGKKYQRTINGEKGALNDIIVKEITDSYVYGSSSQPSASARILIDYLLSQAAFRIQQKSNFRFKIYKPRHYVFG